MPIPEHQAREIIDRLQEADGWHVQDRNQPNLSAAQGIALCEFPLSAGGTDGSPLGGRSARGYRRFWKR
jgi:hypothetical protein